MKTVSSPSTHKAAMIPDMIRSSLTNNSTPAVAHAEAALVIDDVLGAQEIAAAMCPYDADAFERHCERIAAVFDEARLRRSAPDESVRPVFIVGMPRSGTTLVERILARHPLVHAAGELEGIGGHVAIDDASGAIDVVGVALNDRELGLGVVNPRTAEAEDPGWILERVEQALHVGLVHHQVHEEVVDALRIGLLADAQQSNLVLGLTAHAVNWPGASGIRGGLLFGFAGSVLTGFLLRFYLLEFRLGLATGRGIGCFIR